MLLIHIQGASVWKLLISFLHFLLEPFGFRSRISCINLTRTFISILLHDENLLGQHARPFHTYIYIRVLVVRVYRWKNRWLFPVFPYHLLPLRLMPILHNLRFSKVPWDVFIIYYIKYYSCLCCIHDVLTLFVYLGKS